MPSKSGIAGICVAALGYPRGSEAERRFLGDFSRITMTAIAIPRQIGNRKLQTQRLHDYHTVQNTKTADGKIKDCHITHRQYLLDARFGILLKGPIQVISAIGNALQDPVWGIFLGRKACIPTIPLFAGLEDSEVNALRLLIGDSPLSAFTFQTDVDRFEDGRDTLSDQAVSFDSAHREFAPRRVFNHKAEL
jgi:CRISPR system Cascade subunit CasD